MRISLQQTVGAGNRSPTGFPHVRVPICLGRLPLSLYPLHLFQGEVVLNLTGFVATSTRCTSATYKETGFKISRVVTEVSHQAGQRTQCVVSLYFYILSAQQVSSYSRNKHTTGIFAGIMCVVACFEPVDHELHYTIKETPKDHHVSGSMTPILKQKLLTQSIILESTQGRYRIMKAQVKSSLLFKPTKPELFCMVKNKKTKLP